jgi:nucleotide-binding universal stress UspA family protein
MYKKVLATVNEYSNSEVAARYAVTFAKACNAKLSLLYVASEGADKDSFNRAEASLRRLFIEAESRGIEVESLTESGDPFEEISSKVRRDTIDIVFTSTRKEDINRRFFARTLSKELILKLPCSVALVRVVHIGKIHPKRILVPLRGRMSKFEERGCFVARLAEGFGCAITLFHAPGKVTSFFHGEVHLPPFERDKRIPGDVEEFVECLNRYGIHHEKRTGHGSVAQSIAIEAMIRRSDLIIMGASERGLLKSILYGNPVEYVMREAPCNLIVFRPGRKAIP